MGLTDRRYLLHGTTVVFDLDGTIADTASDLIDAANAALLSEGFPFASPEAIREGVGYGTKAMLSSALRSMKREADAEQMQRLTLKLVQVYDVDIARKTRLFPRFLPAAETLRVRGAKLALCTNKPEALALKLISALGIRYLFDAIAGRDTFPFCKPDPRHITEVVLRAAGDPTRAIMIGDSEADVASAKGAGIPVFAVRFGYSALKPEELGADAILDDFGDLVEAVEARFAGQLADETEITDLVAAKNANC